MLTPPVGLDEQDLVAALALHWEFDTHSIEHAPVGFGSYHWIVRDADGARRFVTVDEPEGDTQTGAAAKLAELTAAFTTATVLRDAGGLDFVLAPLPTTAGEVVARLDKRHTIAVFPFVEGSSGIFGGARTARERVDVVRLLAHLHGSTDLVRDTAPPIDVTIPEWRYAEAALQALDVPWVGGPYSEPAHAWLDQNANDLRALRARFDDLATATTPDRLVITQGEPHPGNFIRTDDGLVLIDWDTVGLALPERDLWLVAEPGDGRDEALTLYAEATGHQPDEAALTRYRLGWDLTDIALYLGELRSPHEPSADADHAWSFMEAAFRDALEA